MSKKLKLFCTYVCKPKEKIVQRPLDLVRRVFEIGTDIKPHVSGSQITSLSDYFITTIIKSVY